MSHIASVTFLAACVAAIMSTPSYVADSSCCDTEREVWIESVPSNSGPFGDCDLQHSEGKWWVLTSSDSNAWLDDGDAFGGIYVSQQGTDSLQVKEPCSGWKYRWSASGKIFGAVAAASSGSMVGSGYSAGSGAVRLEEDLAAFDSAAAAATDSSSSVEVSISVGSSGTGGGIAWSTSTVSATMPGSFKHLHDNDVKMGPGYKVQVGIDQRAEATSHADTSVAESWLSHTRKASSSAAAYPTATLTLSIFCRSPSGSMLCSACMTVSHGPDKGAYNAGAELEGYTFYWDPLTPSVPKVLSSKPAPKEPAGDANQDGWHTYGEE